MNIKYKAFEVNYSEEEITLKEIDSWRLNEEYDTKKEVKELIKDYSGPTSPIRGTRLTILPIINL